MKYKILLLNAISAKGLHSFDPEKYALYDMSHNIDLAQDNIHAILVRSSDMHQIPLTPSLNIIGRAGVGVNNIPVDACTGAGIPVINAPGANANAVKELVIGGMLLASRHLCAAWDYARQLTGTDETLHAQVEKNKKKFSGTELQHKTLGVIGLGNIGVKVANTAVDLGMKVVGFDNFITVDNAWQLSANVQQARTLAELCAHADFISLHVPLIDSTRHFINADLLRLMKQGVVILNFARDEIIDQHALHDALSHNTVSTYVCDFPTALFQGHPHVIGLPHLGASTQEAEENCAIMVARNIQAYLEVGNIKHAVNFPEVSLPRTCGHRLAIVNRNVPNIIAQITSHLSHHGINIIDMINKSRDQIAYNLIDIDTAPSAALLEAIQSTPGVVKLRVVF